MACHLKSFSGAGNKNHRIFNNKSRVFPVYAKSILLKFAAFYENTHISLEA